uniref:Protein FAR1-RELATED SEQUENCE n=1 Tax=Lactuca sativa TaxID=4236 RepID=A0A9R1VU82_LACSA|nr:hypothetical protein LSAT_V11C400171750 [Lactuca sativa]
MMEWKKNVPTFSFEFRVVQKKYNALFWVDETAKYNYNAFRDIVSLDVTFNMNKYDMVCVKFTVMDNHKKCDPALNNVVNEVLPMSHHRFCMWHITKKNNHMIFSTPLDSCLDEFNISNNKWMKEMYGLRRRWIPAFLKHISMPGLMRTTSLSKGQNWSFQNTTPP